MVLDLSQIIVDGIGQVRKIREEQEGLGFDMKSFSRCSRGVVYI